MEKLTEELRISNIRNSNQENRVEALITMVTGFEGLLKDSCRQNQSPSGIKRRRSNESRINRDEGRVQLEDVSMVIDNNAAATPASRNAFITRCDDKFAAVASTSPAATVAAAATVAVASRQQQ